MANCPNGCRKRAGSRGFEIIERKLIELLGKVGSPSVAKATTTLVQPSHRRVAAKQRALSNFEGRDGAGNPAMQDLSVNCKYFLVASSG